MLFYYYYFLVLVLVLVFFFLVLYVVLLLMAVNVEMTLCCNEDYFTYLFILTHKLNNSDE